MVVSKQRRRSFPTGLLKSRCCSVQIDRPAEYEQQSHELRFTYDAGGALKLVAGVYDWQSEYDIQTAQLDYLCRARVPFWIFLSTRTKRLTRRRRSFEADYAFSDSWTLTLGGRYTKDEKLTPTRGNLPADADADWSEFTPKVGSANIVLNDDAMLYATYSEGYRSGGFNGRVDSFESATIPYNPEFLENYELGFQTTSLVADASG